MISQGISLKVVLDGIGMKPHIQDAFGIPDAAIFVLVSDANRTTGIEDIFSPIDYRSILTRAGYDVSEKELMRGNSTYAKRTNKRVVAQTFFNEIGSYAPSTFEESTRRNLEAILSFCDNDQWWLLP